MHELSKGCYPPRHNQNHISYMNRDISYIREIRRLFSSIGFFFLGEANFFSASMPRSGTFRAKLENIASADDKRSRPQEDRKVNGRRKRALDERYLRLAISLDDTVKRRDNYYLAAWIRDCTNVTTFISA